MDGSTGTSPRAGFVAGALAASTGVLTLLLLRILAGGPSLPELVQEGIVQLLPGALFSSLLDQLRFSGKPLLFGSIVVGMLVVGGAVGSWYGRRPRTPSAAAWLGLALYLAIGLLLLPLLAAGPFAVGRPAEAPVWLTSLIATAVFVAILHALTRSAPASTPDLERRRVLRLAGGGLALGAFGLVGWRAVALGGPGQTASAPPTPSAPTDSAVGPPRASPSSGDEHVTPAITPVGTFYNVSKNFIDPTVKLDGWSLSIGGMVEQPLTLAYEDLKALPSVEQPATLCCISNEVGGDLIGNAVWKGVRLADLLATARVKPGAVKAAFQCRDDYRDSIVLERALNPGTLLAYEMNGAPLTEKHGFPLRLIVPGIYGMKNVKWLEKIDLVPDDFKGFWQKQGWSDPAPYQTTSRIDAPSQGQRPRPSPAIVQGVAFAGDRGITRVEVSGDGGQSWREARLLPAMGPFTWVRWTIDWPLTPGAQAAFKVRATDGTGALQTEESTPPFPDGATGWHTVSVRALDA
ncbi:MAG TPA: molybdopterin-dependent oxidoreductase [Chloroflexota bacterium]